MPKIITMNSSAVITGIVAATVSAIAIYIYEPKLTVFAWWITYLVVILVDELKQKEK